MESDIPTQSMDKKSRLGDLHLAFVMDTDVAVAGDERED